MMAFLILFLHVLVSPFKARAMEPDQKQSATMANFPSVLNAITIVLPETIIRWHRTGFRLYWRWKSRSRGGREIRHLIREMSLANRLWGAPRILSLLKTPSTLA